MVLQTYLFELAYDADTDFYNNGNVRKTLIKLLLKNKAFNLKSYVKTTIIFSMQSTDRDTLLADIEKVIQNEFGDKFYYVISIILFESIRFNPKDDFSEKFQDDVDQVTVDISLDNFLKH